MNKRGIKIGSFIGIEISIDLSWLVIFAAITWILATSYYPGKFNIDQSTSISLAFITSSFFFLSALIHEMIHVYVAQINKIKIKRITLYLFGALSELFEEPTNPDTEFKISIAGPTTSMIITLLFMALWVLSSHYYNHVSLVAFFSTMFQINLFLTTVNLLPGFPLDGGRILRSIIWASNGDLLKATRTSSLIGQLIAFILICFGVFDIILTGSWSGIWFVFIGLFLNQASTQDYLELRIKKALEEKTVMFFAEKYYYINPKLSIGEAISEYFLKFDTQIFPVATNEKIIGVLSLNDINKKRNRITTLTRVEEVMKTINIYTYLKPGDSALKALKIMAIKQLGFIPIKDHDKIVGMITLERIASYLAEVNII